MLDHIGFPVSDYARSKAFYEKALAPLGYGLVMEVSQSANDKLAAGFGANGNRPSGSAAKAASIVPCMSR